MGSIFFCSFLERDAFDALFDNAPEKLNVVKKVLYMQFNFCEIMAALKVLYSKVHEVIATDLPQSKTICLSWKMLFLLRDFWLSFAYSLVENIFIVYYAWAFFRILLG